MTADVPLLRRVAILPACLAGLCAAVLMAGQCAAADGAASGGTPAIVETSAQRTPHPKVSFDNRTGLITVQAQGSSLLSILRDISLLTGVPIVLDPAIKTTVTVTFQDFPLEKALERVLGTAGERNLAMEFIRKPGAGKDDLTIEKITVVRGAPQQQRTIEEIAAGIALREKEYRDYFAKMDREGNKIARALKKRLDPRTSDEESLKLKTFLRQTSVDDPEDKKVLKAALMDSRFEGGIVSDIQMALLHAMQSHPEESDKDYIVKLLERRDNRVGWLYYAMLKVWDERYVPYLMESLIKEEGLVNIEILGRMGVKKAIPFLEVALKSKKPEIRSSAYDALFHLTGKKYEIEW